MSKKILLPFALSTMALLLNGCGGGSSNINENPSSGNNDDVPTSSAGCAATNTDCIQFALDYPIEGLNFNCSSTPNQHFITLKDGNTVTGSCKTGDTVSFYLKGNSQRKVELGAVQLDTIGKYTQKTYDSKGNVTGAIPIWLTVLDIATGITGQVATSTNANDPTIAVAMSLLKVFQSIGVERGDNVVGDLQLTKFTQDKKNTLDVLTQNITATEWKNGTYASILKPWIDVSRISDTQAHDLLIQIINLNSAALYQANEAFYAGINNVADALPWGFYGCNQDALTDCFNISKTNLRHQMGSLFLLTDRQGYGFGYGLQWRGNAKLSTDDKGNVVGLLPLATNLWTTAKPIQMVANPQNNWLNPLTKSINQSLRLSVDDNSSNDLEIYQGKFFNEYAVAGTEGFYKALTRASIGNTQHYGLWRQMAGSENYKGSLDLLKTSPVSYLDKSIFKTQKNVGSTQRYVFPLYATLHFEFDGTTNAPVDLGVVIDEYGDIRTDIKPNATDTDMSGMCATVSDPATMVDSLGVQQYRIGTTGGTESSLNDSSMTVRVILSSPQLKNLNGIMFGLNAIVIQGTGSSSGQSIRVGDAKMNIANLLSGQINNGSINLTNYNNEAARWANPYAVYQSVYNGLKAVSPAPTDAEKALAQRISGKVSMKLADQSNLACNALKIKP